MRARRAMRLTVSVSTDMENSLEGETESGTHLASRHGLGQLPSTRDSGFERQAGFHDLQRRALCRCGETGRTRVSSKSSAAMATRRGRASVRQRFERLRAWRRNRPEQHDHRIVGETPPFASPAATRTAARRPPSRRTARPRRKRIDRRGHLFGRVDQPQARAPGPVRRIEGVKAVDGEIDRRCRRRRAIRAARCRPARPADR